MANLNTSLPLLVSPCLNILAVKLQKYNREWAAPDQKSSLQDKTSAGGIIIYHIYTFFIDLYIKTINRSISEC